MIFHNYLFDPPLRLYVQYLVQIYTAHEVRGTTPVVTKLILLSLYKKNIGYKESASMYIKN